MPYTCLAYQHAKRIAQFAGTAEVGCQMEAAQHSQTACRSRQAGVLLVSTQKAQAASAAQMARQMQVDRIQGHADLMLTRRRISGVVSRA